MNQDDPIFPGPEIDPYAPPAANLGEAPFGDESSSELAEVEAIRKKHLATEVSIKSLGSLHILAAIFLLSGLAESAIVVFSGRMRDRPSAPFIGMMIYMVFITGVNFFLGFGLRSLNVWARWTDVVVICLGFLVNAAPWIRGAGGAGRLGSSPVIAIPSLLVQICILVLLLGKQGAFVFTPEYRRVIEMTPYVKYRTSWLFKGCLVVLFPLFALLIITALFVPRL